MGVASMLATGPEKDTYTNEANQLEAKLTVAQGQEAIRRGWDVMKKLAEAGVRNAQFTVGSFFFAGSTDFGVAQDYDQAFAWFRRVADQDHPDAQLLLGRAAEGQFGQPQNLEQAAQWYRRSAAQGMAPAMGSLGLMHVSGAGVPVDVVEAHKWLNLGATRAVGGLHDTLTTMRDELAAKLSPEQLADAQQRARQWMTAFDAVYPTPPASQLPPAALPLPPPPMEPVRVGGEIKTPTLLKKVDPIYPAIAQSARVQGVVILEAVIGPDGRVREAKVIRSIPLLGAAAIDAVRQWEYVPTLLNDVPVPVIMTVTVSFTLK